MKPTFIGRPFEGSVHRNTAYNPSLQSQLTFPSRADCSLSRKLRLVVVGFFSGKLLMKHLFPSNANTLLT